MNMYQWIEDLKNAKVKKSMPILSFSRHAAHRGDQVRDVCTNSDLQADMMKAVADRAPTLAAVGLMDLSVEAECFGSNVVKNPDDIPTIHDPLITDLSQVENLKVPEVGAARSGLYIEGIEKLLKRVTDRPVFAGCVGPFSLAGV